MDVDESYLSYRLKPCDGNTDKTKAYRLKSKDYLKEYNKTIS